MCNGCARGPSRNIPKPLRTSTELYLHAECPTFRVEPQWGKSTRSLYSTCKLETPKPLHLTPFNPPPPQREARLYQRVAELAGKPTDKFVLPVPAFNAAWTTKQDEKAANRHVSMSEKSVSLMQPKILQVLIYASLQKRPLIVPSDGHRGGS